MLKTNYLKINVHYYENTGFFLTGEIEDRYLYPNYWKKLLFQQHHESYYGTILDTVTMDGIEGVLVSGWQLVTLLATEGFNRYVEWDWNDTAQVCLAAAPSILESIKHKEWIPDFSQWEVGNFQWSLPHRVIDEFDPSFWEMELHDELEGQTNNDFINRWFQHSLNHYLEGHKETKQSFHERMDTLKNANIPSEQLAAYFTEDKWQEWMGLKETDYPFTLGIRLEEPTEIDTTWDLDLFLKSKENPDLVVDIYDESNMPKKWLNYASYIEEEQQRWLLLFPWLKGTKGITNQLTEEEAWLFLSEASETFLALGVDILLPSWWQAMKSANLKVKAKVSSSSHRPSYVGLQAMLDYNWRFSMNGVTLSEEEFHNLVEEKRRLVFIKGRWIKLDPAFIRQIQDLMKKAEKEGLHVRDIIEQELMQAEEQQNDELENPKTFAKIQIELNRQWRTMIHQLKEVRNLPLEAVPQNFLGDLRDYQVLGMSWLLFLRKYGFGAILADDMGLGKTVQLISYLLKVKEIEKEQTAPALIICPTSVLGNWQKELERFAPDLNVYLHYGANRLKDEAFVQKAQESDVVLTSYGLTHIDLQSFQDLTWSTIAIDEAQNIKNAQTKQSRAVRKLKSQHNIALSGTPMENRLNELWSIFDFTNHGYLGSLGQFQKRFVIPIEKENKPEQIQQLQTLIRPFLLRRTKKDEEVALNLPDKLEQKEYCPLTTEQAALYEQLVTDTFVQIEQLSGFERKGLVLQMLSKLKQLCNHPALYLKEQTPTSLLDRSVKMEKLAELTETIMERKESCLIFTQYIEMGHMIQEMMMKNFKVEVPFLNGSMSKQQRDRLIEQFQNGEFPIFLLSLKAGGTGLNLTAANHVIHYDRWWNPAVENQATDRAYRIGQTRFVHVHKLICTGTLEEKIDAMLEKKQSLNDQIIQNENWMTELTTDELKDLVSLNENPAVL
ncbi:DEAD/DEAH box helicase [Niallia circulans]|uniref:DEAD/DEAH box helicase n=1 Tax=Niallia circulans TaxID=1397 RepID=A0A941GAJ4_NIACI|nr:DEAD/DEAH box helicase [Niallia circulans]MCB5239978.1 DEAD/DEAH box helicase [Niallia circulans]